MIPLTTHTTSPAPTEPELARTPPGEMKMPEPELFVPAPSSRNSLFWRELVSFGGFGPLRSEATRGGAEYQVWHNFSRTLYD